MKKQLLVIPFLFVFFLAAFSEGTKQVTPANPAGPLPNIQLQINRSSTGGFPSVFAGWTATSSYDRLYFHIKDYINEKVYLGFREAQSGSVYFRIKRPDGTVVYPTPGSNNGKLIPSSGAGYIGTWAQAVAGPGGTGGLTGIIGGYTPLVFTPNNNASSRVNGDFYIEFNTSQTTPNTNEIFVTYYDITIANGPAASDIQTGRLWAYNWGFNSSDFPFPEGSMLGSLFVYPSDSVVTEIDLNGLSPYYFRIYSNAMGVTNTGNLIADRKSRYYGENTAPDTYPQYKIFLNDPDSTVYPSGTNVDRTANFNSFSGCPGDYCFNVTVNGNALLELRLDLNHDGDYSDPIDRILEYNGLLGANCIPWDGLDGLGNAVPINTVFFIELYSKVGVCHFPEYDAEGHHYGYLVDPVRPSGIGNLVLYWDDTNVPALGTKELLGIAPSAPDHVNNYLSMTTGLHTWLDPDGNATTVNTWYAIRKVVIANFEVTLLKCADMAIAKSDGHTTYTPGTNVVYTVTATNAGPNNVPNGTVTDVAPSGTSITSWTAVANGSASVLPPTSGSGNIVNKSVSINAGGGNSVVFTITLAVPSDFTGNLVNTATVATPADISDTYQSNNTDTDTDTQNSLADLEVIKTVDLSTPIIGSNVVFTLQVINHGPSAATGVSVADLLPSGYIYVSDDSGGSYNSGTGIWSIGNLAFQANAFLHITATVKETGNYNNIATVSGNQNDPIPGNNIDEKSTNPLALPSLEVNKTQTSGPHPVTVAGHIIGYTITVINTGNISLSGVTINDILPDGTTGTLTGPAGDGGTLNVIDVLETWTYTINYTVTQADMDAGLALVNTVSVITNEVPGPVTDSETTDVSQIPILYVTKDQTGGPDPVETAGDVINYTITLHNQGNVTLTGVVASDILPDGTTGTLSGPTGDLGIPDAIDLGETWTYTISYTVTQTDIDDGLALVNTVSVETNEVPDPVTDSEITDISQNPFLHVTKTQTGGPDPVTDAGQVISYTIHVHNHGNIVLTGVVVSDILPDGTMGTLIGPAGDLGVAGEIEVDEAWTYTISYAVTQADMDLGLALVNMVSVVTTQLTDPVTDSEITSISQDPFLHVTKTQTGGPDPVTAAGQVINYTITLHNHGNVTLTGVVVSDILPDGTTGTLSGPTGDLGIPDAIDIDEAWTYTISYTVTQADVDEGWSLVNIVSAVTNEVPGPTTDSENTPISQNPFLHVTKTQTGGPDPVTAAGQVINYTITLHNHGNVTHTGVVVIDILPDGTTGTLIGPTGDNGIIGAIDIGEAWIYTISYTVTQADIDNGQALVNTVNGVSVEDPGPNVDTETTGVLQLPALSINKTAIETLYGAVNDVLNYTITVTNTGNVLISGLMVTDNNSDAPPVYLSGDAGVIGTLDLGESWIYTASHTITQDDLDAGQVDNTATANGTPSGGTLSPATDNETVFADQNPYIDLVKTGTYDDFNSDGVVNAGDKILYAFAVTNAGNVTLTDVTLSDNDATLSGGPIQNLAPGVTDIVTFTGEYILIQTNINAGTFTNTAIVAGTPPDGLDVTDQDSDTQNFIQDATIDLDKTGTYVDNPPLGAYNAGDQINYVFTITNTGNVTLTNVIVTDPLVTVIGDPIASVAPGAMDNTTFTAVYILQQSDIEAGSYTNIATVTGIPPSGPGVSDTDDYTHVSPCVTIQTWVYLEGSAINPGGTESYTLPMRTSLNNLQVLPGQTYQNFFTGIVYSPPGQPYNTAPWNYGGTEGAGYDSDSIPNPGTANYSSTVVDWVLVSLRNAADGVPLCQTAALLHSDGSVEFVNGGFPCCDLDFSNSYYLVIEHRNHLIVMSHIPIPIVNGTLTYDFRSHQSYIDDPFGFGAIGQKEILPGIFAMFAGNGNQVLTNYSDTDINIDDRTYWDVQNGTAGRYRNGDYNLNGDCNNNDRKTWKLNNGKFTTVPRN